MELGYISNTFSQKTPSAISSYNSDFHITYRIIPLCSFNGKEKDPESGFHYYGARYYWSELLTGWLSVDPMADKYPNISPYAYCAWNPVRLVDPDGLEPIKPLIMYTGGGNFYVNVKNLSPTTRNRINIINSNPNNWPKGNIGINLRIGQVTTLSTISNAHPTVGVKPEHTSTRVVPPTAKSTSLPDKRFTKTRRIVTGPAMNGGGKAMGWFSIGVDLLNFGTSYYFNSRLNNDNKELKRQTDILLEAYGLVNESVSNNIIPNAIARDVNLIGAIVNYVFQGESYENNPIVSYYGELILRKNNYYDKDKKNGIPLLEVESH